MLRSVKAIFKLHYFRKKVIIVATEEEKNTYYTESLDKINEKKKEDAEKIEKLFYRYNDYFNYRIAPEKRENWEYLPNVTRIAVLEEYKVDTTIQILIATFGIFLNIFL